MPSPCALHREPTVPCVRQFKEAERKERKKERSPDEVRREPTMLQLVPGGSCHAPCDRVTEA